MSPMFGLNHTATQNYYVHIFTSHTLRLELWECVEEFINGYLEDLNKSTPHTIRIVNTRLVDQSEFVLQMADVGAGSLWNFEKSIQIYMVKLYYEENIEAEWSDISVTFEKIEA